MLRDNWVKGSLLRMEHFMQSSKHIYQAMGLFHLSLVSLVKSYDSVDPNLKITTHLLRYMKMAKCNCKPPPNNGQVWHSHKVTTWGYLYSKHVTNFKALCIKPLLKWTYFHSLLSLLISFVHVFIARFSLLSNKPFLLCSSNTLHLKGTITTRN